MSSSPDHSCIVGHAFSLRAFALVNIYLSVNTQEYVRYPAKRPECRFDIFCGDFRAEVPDKDVKVICRKETALVIHIEHIPAD